MSEEKKDRSFEEYLEKLENMNAASLAGEIKDLEECIRNLSETVPKYGIPFNTQVQDYLSFLELFCDAAYEKFRSKIGLKPKEIVPEDVFNKYLDQFDDVLISNSIKCAKVGTVFGVTVKNYVTNKEHKALYQTLFGVYESVSELGLNHFIIVANYDDPVIFFQMSLPDLTKTYTVQKAPSLNLEDYYHLSYADRGVLTYKRTDSVNVYKFTGLRNVFLYTGYRKDINNKRFESIMLTKRALIYPDRNEVELNTYEDFVILAFCLDESILAEFTLQDMNGIEILDEPLCLPIGDELPNYFPLVEIK